MGAVNSEQLQATIKVNQCKGCVFRPFEESNKCSDHFTNVNEEEIIALFAVNVAFYSIVYIIMFVFYASVIKL